MSFTIDNATGLGIGSTASLYRYSGPIITPPAGTPLETAVVQPNGTLTFTTVSPDLDYVATAGGKYIAFHTPPLYRPGAGHVIEDESTPLTDRPALAFKGAAVTVTDDSANNRTVVSVSADTVFNVKDAAYGAVGDDSTDDTAAIQAALTACKNAGGGTIYFPPGTYKVSSSLSMIQAYGWRISGAGNAQQLNTSPAVIHWTGAAGSGPILKVYSCTNFEIDHVRFKYTNSAYNGDMIDIDGGASGVPAADCQDWHIHHISTRGDAGGLQYTSARSAIRLNKAIIGSIDHVQLTGAINPLRVGDPGGSYVVGVQVSNSTFNYAADAMILIGSADLEAFSVDGCTFEAGNNTPAIRGATTAVDGGQNLIYGMSVRDCWFGDSSAPFTWIKTLHTTAGKPIVIQGNRFATNSSTTGDPHISGDGIFLIQGNSFEGGDIFQYVSGGASTTTVLLIGNQAVVRRKINNPSSSFQVVELGNVFAYNGTFPQTIYNTQYDRVGGSRFAFGGAAKPAQPDMGTGNTEEDVVWGAFANALNFATAGMPIDKAFRGIGKTPNPSALRSILDIAPWDGSAGGWSVFAGSGPYQVQEWQGAGTQAGCKLGFWGAIPVAQPSSTGTATGFTAGAGTAVKDDSTFTGGVGSTAYRISDVVKALKQLGLLAS